MDGKELQLRLAENIKRLREKNNLIQRELGGRADVSEVSIKKIETCNQWPSQHKIAAIATALNVDVYELFLPVPSSFEIDSKIKKSIIDTARKSFKNFLDTVKDEI